MERPRTRFLETAVSYLTAKAQIAVLNADYQALVLRNIYVSDDTPSRGDNGSRTSQPYVSGTALILSPNIQFGSSEYQGRQHQAPRAPPFNEYQGQQQYVNSQQWQQLPRQDPGLQALQNVTQSQQQRVKPQHAFPQAPHSQPPDNGTLAQQQQVTQHAPPPQAPHLQLAQNSHQSQDLQQSQQSRAEPTPNDSTQTSSYQQPPSSSSPQVLCDSPQPNMTPAEALITPPSSIGQQNLDNTQPQPQENPTRNELGIFLDSLRPNTISADNPSTTGSMGQQNLGVSQPQYEQDSIQLDFSQQLPIDWLLGHPEYNPNNINDPFPDMDIQEDDPDVDMEEEGNVIDLTGSSPD
ncbi:hypothetical protein FAGAP_9074 [Fusarium agapanthi]|uniref:Uncharacterized protein n=1 Tax=Fusarium agapanthi TaxID=1803897 RepID=A0A9P5B3R2_9HYPO|nr:hypothetical protein FAGAP_9074 [Fusarium agapanthi]